MGYTYTGWNQYTRNFFYDGLVFYINGEEIDQFQPTPEGETPWTYISYPVSPGEYIFTWSYVKDGGGGSTEMEEDCTWIDVVEFPPTVGGPSTINMEVSYPADWNLVSLPVSVDNNDMEVIFPNAVQNSLYSFDGQYSAEDQLSSGEGYWIRFENDNINSFTGYELNELTIALNEGWNLIGGLSTTIGLETAIIDIDEIIVPGTLYGFIDGGYENISVLNPGYGYWIRSFEVGEITLTSMPTSLNRIFPDVSTILDNLNIIEINGKSLYFGEDVTQTNEIYYSLPPKFDGLSNDVRFKENTYISCSGGNIHVLSALQYNTFYYNISTDENWKITNKNDNYSRILNGSGVFQIEGDISHLFLEKIQLIPENITISPSFPNPFNNETRLTYSLPQDTYILMEIFNLRGELIKSLVNEHKNKGIHSVKWKGIDNHLRQVSSGTYFLSVSAGDYNNISKIILLK